MYRFVHLIWSAYRYVFVLYVVQDASGNVRQFLAAGDEVLDHIQDKNVSICAPYQMNKTVHTNERFSQ
jgi:hypothetical protein